MINGEIRRNNPFRISFLSVTIICCVALSLVFFYISYINDKVVREQYAEEKTEMIMRDLEAQLDIMEGVASKIATNYEFQPNYFEENLARELSMLEILEQYRYYTALTEDCFVYYGGKWIYRSSGKTLTMDRFLETKSENVEERQQFYEIIKRMQEREDDVGKGLKIYEIFDEIYVMIPIRVSSKEAQSRAILVFTVKKSDLEERFQVVSGGIEGALSLYREEVLLYSNHTQSIDANQKNVIATNSTNGLYTICYLPEREYGVQSGMFFLQLLLVVIDIFLVFVVANVFAERAYKPIQVLAEKYREKNQEKEKLNANALEELNYLMDNLLQNNEEANLRIQKNNKILRKQILQLILEGRASKEALSYLDNLEICLPGSYYWVVSISYQEEVNLATDFLLGIQEELEQLPDNSEKEYVYLVCSLENKLINAICSVTTEEGKNDLTEAICDVAESFTYEPMIGIGNTYQSLNNLSASWLESMDIIQSKKNLQENAKKQGYIYDSEELRRISEALENGSKKGALERLRVYVNGLSKSPMSMLMQQYILADFLGEMRRIGEKYRVEMSKQNISLLLSSRNASDFEKAAIRIINELCEGYEATQCEMKEEEAKKIFEYINVHFAEYDISLENVAAKLYTSTEAVRQAVLKYTGQTYKDYLISLRIEYAKKLLQLENIPVAEVCQKIGYGNVSYFIKLFREMTGVTPAKYRRNNVFS